MAIRNCRAFPTSRATFHLMPDVNLEDLEAQTDVTVVAQLANQKQYTLASATCKAGFEAIPATVRPACAGKDSGARKSM